MNRHATAEKLNPDEIRAIASLRRRMVVTFAVSMGLLVITAAADLFFGLTQLTASVLFGMLVTLVIVAGLLRFSEKCPRCAYRIGLQSSLVVPERCKKCGVRLK